MKKLIALTAMALMAVASPIMAEPHSGPKGGAKQDDDSFWSGGTAAAAVIGALFVGGGAGALWSNSNSEGYSAPGDPVPPGLQTFILEGHSHQ